MSVNPRSAIMAMIEQHFLKGCADGTSWAEQDSQRPSLMHDEAVRLRSEATHAHSNRVLGPQHETFAAYSLGLVYGYRKIMRQ